MEHLLIVRSSQRLLCMYVYMYLAEEVFSTVLGDSLRFFRQSLKRFEKKGAPRPPRPHHTGPFPSSETHSYRSWWLSLEAYRRKHFLFRIHCHGERRGEQHVRVGFFKDTISCAHCARGKTSSAR
jgi:hypothetical protein